MASVLATILLVLLAVIGGLLLALVVLPFEVRAEGTLGADDVGGELRARWGFGFLGVRLSSRRRSGLTLVGVRVAGFPRRHEKTDEEKARARAKREARKQKQREKRERARRAGRRPRGLRWLLAHRDALGRVLVRLLSSLAPRLEVRGRVGLGDPTHTAVASLAAAELGRIPGVELAVAWDYVDDIVELEARASGRIWIAHVVAIALGLWLGDREVRELLRVPS